MSHNRRRPTVIKFTGDGRGLSKAINVARGWGPGRSRVGTNVHGNTIIGVTNSGHPKGITQRLTVQQQLHEAQAARKLRKSALSRMCFHCYSRLN